MGSHLVAAGCIDLARITAYDDCIEALHGFDEGVVPQDAFPCKALPYV